MKRETARQKGRAVSGSFRPRAAPAPAAAASRVPPPPAGPPHSRPGPARPSRRRVPAVVGSRGRGSAEPGSPAPPAPPRLQRLRFPSSCRGRGKRWGPGSAGFPGAVSHADALLPAPPLPPADPGAAANRPARGDGARSTGRRMDGPEGDERGPHRLLPPTPAGQRGREGRSHPPADTRLRAHLLEEKRGSGLVPYHPVAEALFRMVSW